KPDPQEVHHAERDGHKRGDAATDRRSPDADRAQGQRSDAVIRRGADWVGGLDGVERYAEYDADADECEAADHELPAAADFVFAPASLLAPRHTLFQRSRPFLVALLFLLLVLFAALLSLGRCRVDLGLFFHDLFDHFHRFNGHRLRHGHRNQRLT